VPQLPTVPKQKIEKVEISEDSDAERVPPTRGPSLGEHTDELLAEIGFSNTEISALHDDKIVAGPR
jgi:crotonobetainyl-CoA:carnitine CoA-transferase CaiB-like acyl-CoA transferase